MEPRVVLSRRYAALWPPGGGHSAPQTACEATGQPWRDCKAQDSGGDFQRQNASQLPLCGHHKPACALVSLLASTHCDSSGILGSGEPQ